MALLPAVFLYIPQNILECRDAQDFRSGLHLHPGTLS